MVDKRRFQNLEWARPERRHPEKPAEEAPATARIETVERDRAEVAVESEQGEAPVQTGLARGRFEEPTIPLAPVSPDEPLFHRCHVCGADNQRSDVTCQHCTADLRTAAQEAFDAKLLQKEHEAQRHERDLEWQREHERVAAAVDPVQQAALGKALAEMVQAERGEATPFAWRLLLLLPYPWRWVAGLGTGVAYLALYWASRRTTGWVWAWMMIGFVSLFLFTPPRFWTQTVDRDRWL